MRPAFGCVILTQGRRPDELRLALASLLGQRGVDLDLVVVGNGWRPTGLPAGVRGLELPDNVGATAGRNAGVPHVRGELLLFLDDDARLPDDDALARIAGMFSAEPLLGLVQPRVADPSGARGPRHWVPRLRVGDPARSSPATAVWEGALAVRRSALEGVGGWSEDFFYFHEGIDLAWRALDAGWRVRYAGDVLALHPALPAARHGAHLHYLRARNRVWLARRHLPLPFAAAYVTIWFLHTALRLRSRRDGRLALRGYRDGLTQPCRRRRLRWRTVWRMTLAGRPPVV